MSTEGTASITQEEVASFAEKLEIWGKQLPAKERALLQIVLARAAGLASEDIETIQVQGKISEVVVSAFHSLKILLTPEAWVQIGEIWQQKGQILEGDVEA